MFTPIFWKPSFNTKIEKVQEIFVTVLDVFISFLKESIGETFADIPVDKGSLAILLVEFLQPLAHCIGQTARLSEEQIDLRLLSIALAGCDR